MKDKCLAKEEKFSLKKWLFFFFFPPRCASCGTFVDAPLCPVCREKVRDAFRVKKFLSAGGNGFADEMLSLFDYDSREVKRILFGWKANDYPEYAHILREYIRQAAQKREFYRNLDLVTYLPRRQVARRRAGFDQAEVIARLIAQELSLPFETLVRRRGFSRAQHRLSGKMREKNVHGVFRPTRSLAGESVLLVDDIVTTGASARECARILKKSGAQKVFVLTLAH